MTHPNHLFADYLLGELGEAAATELETHLASCNACAQELAQLAAPLITLTEAMPQSAPSERSWESLQARFKEAVSAKASVQQGVPGGKTLERSSPPPLTDNSPLTKVPYRWLMAACLVVFTLATSLFWGWRNYAAYQRVQAEVAQLNAYLSKPLVQKVVLENVLGSERSESPGSALLTPEGRALFVLTEDAPANRTYQAWGHTSGDWDPEGGETLTSLLVSQSKVFEVEGANFASLYLSLEPSGGSPQPTQPLSKVSLIKARPSALLELSLPKAGAELTTNRVIVSGSVRGDVSSLSYSLNGSPATEVSFANNRFNFTVNDLVVGQNVIELRAASAAGRFSESVTVTYEPNDSR